MHESPRRIETPTANAIGWLRSMSKSRLVAGRSGVTRNFDFKVKTLTQRDIHFFEFATLSQMRRQATENRARHSVDCRASSVGLVMHKAHLSGRCWCSDGADIFATWCRQIFDGEFGHERVPTGLIHHLA